MAKKILVIGAGPIGLEAALYASELGFAVEVVERGSRVGHNIRQWGHVRFFTPWSMNHTPLSFSALKSAALAWHEPNAATCPTGAQYVESFLDPLSRLLESRITFHFGKQVMAVGRDNVLKGDLIGQPQRKEYPFRVLCSNSRGREEVIKADIVLDASGVFGTPNSLGAGGIPAPGERQLRGEIDYGLPDVAGKERSRFADKKTLLLGAGYSAATVVMDFKNLIAENPATALFWRIREERDTPIPEIPNDELPGRTQLTQNANRAANEERNIDFRSGSVVEAVAKKGDGLEVHLQSQESIERLQVDRIIAAVGFGPDNTLYRELQVHECYASRGPMKLAAALLGAASGSQDCLSQGSMGADTLKNPEPNFFIIGNKSYGRNPLFLLQTGFSQIAEVFTLITGDQTLNLYESQPLHEAEVA